jgi:hypothetical protein
MFFSLAVSSLALLFYFYSIFSPNRKIFYQISFLGKNKIIHTAFFFVSIEKYSKELLFCKINLLLQLFCGFIIVVVSGWW